MSTWYTFFDNDGNVIDSGGWAGMPSFYDYDLDIVSPCDSCPHKRNFDSDDFGECYGCFKPMNCLYKITEDDIPKLTNDMLYNKNLFFDLIKQYKSPIWVKIS